MGSGKIPEHLVEDMKRNEASALIRWEVFNELVKDLKTIPEEIVCACETQKKFAKLDSESLKITPMSLNTLKETADRVLTARFEGLNNLRLIIKEYHRNPPVEEILKTGTKDYYIKELSNLQTEHQIVIDSCAFMASKYNSLLRLVWRIIFRAKEGHLVPEKEERLLRIHLETFDNIPEREFTVLPGGKSESGEKA